VEPRIAAFFAGKAEKWWTCFHGKGDTKTKLKGKII
jgi:hypothetical protein